MADELAKLESRIQIINEEKRLQKRNSVRYNSKEDFALIEELRKLEKQKESMKKEIEDVDQPKPAAQEKQEETVVEGFDNMEVQSLEALAKDAGVSITTIKRLIAFIE
jgi:hypothetical protein